MSKKKRILIVGGVAGGASCAARARRLNEDAEIIVFERGPFISFANCGLPYHIGETIKRRCALLLQTPEKMKARFNIDVRVQSEVLAIDRKAKTIQVKNLKTGDIYEEGYDNLVLSPGAKPVRPPIPGIDLPGLFTLRNIPDMDAIINWIETKRVKHAVVVGGGYIGLEMAENLRELNIQVTLVEMLDQVMGPADKEMTIPLSHELTKHGVDLKLGTSVTGFEPNGEDIDVCLNDNTKLHAQLIILAIGVKPESELAQKAGIEVSERGGIQVDEYLKTSDPAIYAVGDAIEVKDFVTGNPTLCPLAGPANRQGRMAADNIFGRKSVYKGTQGTGICKVFDLTIGMTGSNEKTLKRCNIPYQKIYIHPSQHVTYYPGATTIILKVLFSPKNGQLLGVQAVGKNDIARKIDVFALAIRAGLTVYDLEDAELCYAPPFGAAKDAVNFAGFTAANFLKGDVGLCHVEDILNPKPSELLLDVRTKEEVDEAPIDHAYHIPVDELRERLQELPKDKELLVFCRSGIRAYIACRLLMQRGFKCKNLSGGYLTYEMR